MAVVLALAACGGGSSGDGGGATSSPSGTVSPGATGPVSGSGSPTSAPPSGTGLPSGAATPAGSVPATPAVSSGQKVAGAELARRMGPAAAAAGGLSFALVASGAQPMTATGVSSGSGTALQLRLKGTMSGDSRFEIIKKSGVAYLKPPAQSGGQSWLRITQSPSDPYRTLYANVFAGMETTSDAGAVTAAVARMGSFTAAAAQTVDGVTCVPYRATPPARVAAQLLPQSFTSLDSATLAASKATTTVWLDAAGLMHRIRTSLTLPKAGGTTVSTVTYSDWGQKVTVTVPAASQLAPRVS